jgi:chromosome partitioning protein
MPMQVLALASQKGGSGKTTLAGHIAVEAERNGAGPVALIDTDPQGSLADWWNERRQETPLFAHTYISRIRADLEAMRGTGIKLVVFDTPPAITNTIETVIELTDLVIIPARPSPHDLRAAGATVEIVERCGKPLVFVVNAATKGARITSEAAIALSQHGTVAPVTVHQRTDFAASMIDGRTVMDLDPASASAQEITQLWQYLASRLNRNYRRTFVNQGHALSPRRRVFGQKGLNRTNAL